MLSVLGLQKTDIALSGIRPPLVLDSHHAENFALLKLRLDRVEC